MMISKSSWIEFLAKFTTIAEACGILIAIIGLTVQWSQANKLARVENAQTLAEQASEFSYQIVNSDSLTDLWYSYGRKPDMTETQKHQYRELLLRWLILHEHAYYQYNSGLLDETLKQSMEMDLKNTIKKHNLSLIEQPMDTMFHADFADYLRKLQNADGNFINSK